MLVTLPVERRAPDHDNTPTAGPSRKKKKRINYIVSNGEEGPAADSADSGNVDEHIQEVDNVRQEQVEDGIGTGDGKVIHDWKDAVKEILWNNCAICVVLLVLVVLPFGAILWNSVNTGPGILLGLKEILTQLLWIVAMTTICLITGRLYVSRNTIFNWTLTQLNDSLTIGINNNQNQNSDDKHVGTQTEEKADTVDITVIKKKYEFQLKSARRQFLKMKRCYAQRLVKLKDASQERGEFLSRLQLKFPDLEKERDLLIAEKEAIEKQHEEEKRRNRELIGRFQRLQQQLGRCGQQKQQRQNLY